MSKLTKNEDAFTGLEAAIVLIAFVVVAAVFSYVVLGAGFFTTQKSQEVVHTSVAQTSSSMEVVGDVIAEGDTAAKKITAVKITLGLSAGGGAIDFNNLLLTYSDKALVVTLKPTAAYWDADTKKFTSSNEAFAEANAWHVCNRLNQPLADDGFLLEPGEQYVITAGIPAGAVGPNSKFTIEVKPSVGSSLAIVRTAPAQIDAIMKVY